MMFRQTMEPDAFIDKEALENGIAIRIIMTCIWQSIEHILEKKLINAGYLYHMQKKG